MHIINHIPDGHRLLIHIVRGTKYIAVFDCPKSASTGHLSKAHSNSSHRHLSHCYISDSQHLLLHCRNPLAAYSWLTCLYRRHLMHQNIFSAGKRNHLWHIICAFAHLNLSIGCDIENATVSLLWHHPYRYHLSLRCDLQYPPAH